MRTLRKVLEKTAEVAQGQGYGGMYGDLYKDDKIWPFSEIMEILSDYDPDEVYPIVSKMHDDAFEVGWSSIVGSDGISVIHDREVENRASKLLKGYVDKAVEEISKLEVKNE
jgi:hypothetical protein